MKYKPILIVAGEPNSIFLEIFFKAIKNNNFKKPIVLIVSHMCSIKNERVERNHRSRSLGFER